MRQILILITASLALFSCKSNYQGEYKVENRRDIKYPRLVIDTIIVNIGLTALEGYSGVHEDYLYYLDQYDCYLYKISLEGEVTEKRFGLGRGPNEIPFPGTAAAINDNKFLILGSSADHLISKNYNDKSDAFERIWHSFHKMPEATTLEDARAYTFFDAVILRVDNDKLFYNIVGNGSVMEPYEQSETYYKDAHIIMEVDIFTGDMRPIGKFSQYYIDNHSKFKYLFIPIYDIDKSGNFIVTYQADSLIYVSDREFSPIKAFGYEGKEMDKNYTPATSDMESIRRAYTNDILNKEKGYYYWVKYVNETDMTFRSYKKGGQASKDGLQVYNGHTLIADVDIPEDLMVAGYIPPYYVSQMVFDLENEIMKFYRFKLE